jgi:hypothetical protein
MMGGGIKIDLEGIGWCEMDGILLAQERDKSCKFR